MFLIEKLPSEDKKPTTKVHPTNKKHQLFQDISNKITEDLNTIWIPPCCKSGVNSSLEDFLCRQQDKSTDPHIDLEAVARKLSKIKGIRQNVNLISNPSTDNIMQQTMDTKQSMDDVKTYETDKTLKELKETAIILRQKLDTLESERNVMDVEYSQAQKNCDRVEADLQNIQNILRSVGISEIESDCMDNILEKVYENISMLHRKSEDLTSKNLSLKMEVAKLKANNTLNEPERSKCRKILTNLKETAKGMKEECEKKEEFRNQLKNKYEKLRGGNKRHIYTKRILEIIGNVVKQNAEIKKILEDTRQLQKEINTLEGQLDRCFSIADETLFKDAKRDDQAKKAYKLLALLHSECNTIVTLVNDTGILSRDIIDLEDNIKAEKSKRTEDILQKIQLDLSKLQNESY
ncbi:coiled-coil domain-containing protein 22 isoform X2 [Maniola jurtina]|nr:coiled-coil domain-containing protein 22 isoform X2 [Maniola jurtina]